MYAFWYAQASDTQAYLDVSWMLINNVNKFGTSFIDRILSDLRTQKKNLIDFDRPQALEEFETRWNDVISAFSDERVARGDFYD
jgi:hypothetical protein